jgi:HSP20 family molecular chaperone IbpA
MSSTAIGTFTCWDGYDDYELVEERPPRPPRRSRLASTSTVPTSPRQGAERGGERPQTSRTTTGQGPREQEYTSLDELWSTLREKKHAAEAKLPLKVKSLEPPQAGSSVVSRFTPEQHVTTPRKATPPKVKRKKSTDCVSFRESRSGRTITATFDLPGMKKEQAHVSFRWNHLVVTWQTVKISEKEEDGRLVREREEKKYTRTIPLPEGTKFEEIRAVMDNRHLTLSYPNMRTVRVEPRPRLPRHAEPRRIEPTVISDGDIKSSDEFENASYLKSTDHSPNEEITEITDISEY